MQNKHATQLMLALIAAAALSACNGGSSTASSNNNAVQTSQLQQYINSLTYTPANGKDLTAGGTRQQSFTTPGGLTINSVDIKFYSGANCTGTNVFTQTLNSSGTNPVTPAAGTYSSNNASNNALCTAYTNGPSSGCAGLYGQMQNGNMRSMQYTYNIDNGGGGSYAIVAGCMYNPNAVVGTTTGVEGVANWTATNVNTDCTGGTCGFSQAYSVTLAPPSIFVTSSKYRGNLLTVANAAGAGVATGFEAADYLCSIDANKPDNGGTYKALVAGANRIPGGSDWVLAANTTYYNANAAIIGTTDANAKLPDVLTNPISPVPSEQIWTGFSTTWGYNDIPMMITANCNNWDDQSNSNGVVALSNQLFAFTGTSSPSNTGYLSGTGGLVGSPYVDNCYSTLRSLYCVAQ